MELTTAQAGVSKRELNAEFMLDVLHAALHARPSEWIFLRELRAGMGRGRSSLQRLDAFALNCLPHLAMKRVCYEIKISRADYLCEMKHPLKRRIGLHYSNEFYFVTPAGMLSHDEVPTHCGLIEIGFAVTEESRRLVRSHEGFFEVDPVTGAYCMVAIQAPWRDTPAPTWQFAAAMLRNQQRAMKSERVVPAKQQKFEFQAGFDVTE